MRRHRRATDGEPHGGRAADRDCGEAPHATAGTTTDTPCDRLHHLRILEPVRGRPTTAARVKEQ
ncbi:hypothetical protein HMPREF3196_00069 [Bifidobacterium bifidum]|uniref:Uncharacterized protein n=1 Tax=Bifidobacterium bifidum TaxID=1681 RepID=A0A133KU08_BIFBI|nr:hypothetical protein HMPREF3196_00069 [Bifidobacterium bifidum]